MSPRDDDAVDPNAPLQEGDNSHEMRPFRLHAGVFRILALAAVALALPITLLVLGLLDMRASRQDPSAAEPGTPPTESLRLRMEQLAAERFDVEPLGDGRQTTTIHAPDSVPDIIQTIRTAARESGGSAVELGENGTVRLLVSLPEEGAANFQRVLANLTGTSQEPPATLHEIIIAVP